MIILEDGIISETLTAFQPYLLQFNGFIEKPVPGLYDITVDFVYTSGVSNATSITFNGNFSVNTGNDPVPATTLFKQHILGVKLDINYITSIYENSVFILI